MRHHIVDMSIHMRHFDLTPREILISILEDEGDDLGWEEESLIQEAAMRLEGSPEMCLRMIKIALKGLLRDGVVIRDGRLICLRE